jgi:hypothetical protein
MGALALRAEIKINLTSCDFFEKLIVGSIAVAF